MAAISELGAAAAGGLPVACLRAAGGGTKSGPLQVEALGDEAFVLRGGGLPRPGGKAGEGEKGTALHCMALPEGDSVALLITEGGQFLALDEAGGWRSTEEPQLLRVVSLGPEPEEPGQEPAPEPSAPRPAPGPGGGPSSLAELRRARHARWLEEQSRKPAPPGDGKPQDDGAGKAHEAAGAPPAKALQAKESVMTDEEFARSLQAKEYGAATAARPDPVRRPQQQRRAVQDAEPEGEPAAAGWGEDPGGRRGGGQMAIVTSLLRREAQPTSAIRFLRGDPEHVFFDWVEKMALSVGNAGHDARNNLRFAAVALEKQAQRGPFGMRMNGGGGIGHGMGMGMGGMGMGMGGMGMGMGHVGARVQENPNHEKNKYPGYFQKIDALSGQLEGLCRGIVTKARQHQRPAIRGKLLPAAMSKVEQMEGLTAKTEEAPMDEMQRAEMRRIIGLQRQYLETLDATLGGSTPRPGLPRPDEMLDFSVANSEVAAQVGELTEIVETRGRSLDARQYILLSRICCNTGHQMQNLAAYCAEDPSLCELAGKIDNLGGEVENRTRSMMVIVHRQEDTGSIPISSRQDLSKNCNSAWENCLEMARLTSSERLRNNSSVAEMAPTLARLQKSLRWAHESAILDIERELSFGFGLFGPKLSRQFDADVPPVPEPQKGPKSSKEQSGRSGDFMYDVVVLGGGPAGITAAEAVAERGLRCAVVEPRRTGIGTASGFNSKVAHMAITEALGGAWESQGLGTALAAAGGDTRSRLKREITQQRRSKADTYGALVEERLKAAGVPIFRGCSRFVGPHTVLVSDFDSGDESEISGDFIIICTGARPQHPPLCQVDGRVVHDFKTIEELDQSDLPNTAIILGGGVIASETASYMAELGVRTTLLAPGEFMKHLDPGVAEALAKHLRERRHVDVRTGCKLRSVVSENCRARVELQDASRVEAECVVVALGSTPNTEWLGLESLPLKLDSRGFVVVDAEMRASLPHIFACGDCCTRGGLLSHAKQHGLLAAATLHRDRSRVHAAACTRDAPAVIWTVPEVAMVGAKGGRAGSFDVVTRFLECDRGVFQSADEEYFLKVVYEAQNFPSKVYIRGVHIFGAHAEKLIARGTELVGKTVEEALELPLPAAATLEELYSINVRKAAKRMADVQAQQTTGSCAAM